jgi:hypothetical protein
MAGHLSLNKGKWLLYTGSGLHQLIEEASLRPIPITTKPAIAAKIIGKNLITVVIQF